MKWLINHWEDVLIALGEHVAIALTALVIASVVSLALGIWAAKNERVYRVSLAVSGFLYTIPTLAFLCTRGNPSSPRIGNRRARPSVLYAMPWACRKPGNAQRKQAES